MESTNCDLVTSFLGYLGKVRQNDPKSVDLRRVHLRRLLLWADETPINKLPTIEPLFPVYLANSKNENTGKPLSPRFIDETCASVRAFLKWIKRTDPESMAAISDDWIEMIHPGNKNSIHSELEEHEFYTLAEVRRLLAVPARTLTEQRDRAAVAMLYLSGMRIGALVTIPVCCVDLEKLQLHQLPSKGVATKYHKAGVTSLIKIPDLLEVVKEWDTLIRDRVPQNGYWYALIGQRRSGPGILRSDNGEGNPVDRRRNFARHLQDLCEKAGIPYRSPHKLRHGNAVFGLDHSRNMKDLKAVSQNLMHSSISITDGLYGRLTSEDINQTITHLADNPTVITGETDMSQVLAIALKLAQRPDLLQNLNFLE